MIFFQTARGERQGGGQLTRLCSPRQEGGHILRLLGFRGGRSCAHAPWLLSARLYEMHVSCRPLPPTSSQPRCACPPTPPPCECAHTQRRCKVRRRLRRTRTVVILNPLVVQHLGHGNGASLHRSFEIIPIGAIWHDFIEMHQTCARYHTQDACEDLPKRWRTVQSGCRHR